MRRLLLAILFGISFSACNQDDLTFNEACYPLSLTPIVLHMKVGESADFVANGGSPSSRIEWTINPSDRAGLAVKANGYKNSVATVTAVKATPYVTVLKAYACEGKEYTTADASIYIH